MSDGPLSKKYRWNLSQWLQRMGVQLGGDQPPLNYSIQPVQILGDASALTSPLLAPLSWFGNSVLTATFAACTVRSVAPGGSFIRHEIVSSSTTTDYAWGFGLGITSTLGGPFQLTPRDMTPVGSSAIVTTGDVVASIGVFDNPNVRSTKLHITEDIIYLAPGREYVIMSATAGRTLSFAFLIQDVPAMIPAN